MENIQKKNKTMKQITLKEFEFKENLKLKILFIEHKDFFKIFL